MTIKHYFWSDDMTVRKKIFSYWAIFFGLTAFLVASRSWEWQGSSHLHTTMEVMATLLAFIVGTLSLLRYYSKKDNKFLLIGAGFIGTGFLDGYHAIVTSEYFISYFPSDMSDLIPWSWVASRLFLAVMLTICWLVWKIYGNFAVKEKLVYVFVFLMTILSFIFFALVPLPPAHFENIFFHRPEEFVPAAFFLIALIGFLTKREWKRDSFEHWLVMSLIVNFLSQTLFMSHSGHVFDFEFDAAHTLKKVSYIYVLVGLMISIYRTFHDREKIQSAWFLEHSERKKAQELNRLKSDFLATMSHEIRTPMNGILGMAELIQGARPSNQIRGYARTISTSGETLMNIIDDILDFSKIEAGKLEFDPMAVDMLDLVDDVAKLYAVKARDKAIELAVRYVPGSAQFVFADPVRIRQILGNLISNAIKFTDKGHVAVTIEEDENSDLPDDKVALRFTVVDTGIGLSEEAQAKIFDKFTQADASTTRQYGGTGLGLSICKSLVQMMGGRITVQSTLGEGAIFCFTIPFTRNHTDAKAATELPDIEGVRVLVVDDLPVIRQLVSEQLAAAGMRPDDAASGDEALEKIQQAHDAGDPYKIGIIDYLMPEMNGEMLASAINDHAHLREICLIMLTSAGNPLADDLFAEKGFSAYIAKPVSNLALIESLAIVWGEYEAGARDVLIHVDAHSLGKDHDMQDEPVLPGVKILVAEDNLVNQVFIKEILEEMEADYTIVSNGLEAVQAVQEQDFKLIMMDCLMPEMDGFDATRAICKLKDSGAIKPMPICALTANAMKGDREKCIESGMDDYLTKPVRKKQLKEKVYALVAGEGSGDDEGLVEALPSPTELQENDNILDIEAVENARSILKAKYDEMVTIYIDNSWERVEEITQAINENNIEGIIRPAHTLKSTSKQMGAIKLSDMSEEIEVIAKALKAEAADNDQDIHSIARSMDELKAALSETKLAFDKMAA